MAPCLRLRRRLLLAVCVLSGLPLRLLPGRLCALLAAASLRLVSPWRTAALLLLPLCLAGDPLGMERGQQLVGGGHSPCRLGTLLHCTLVFLLHGSLLLLLLLLLLAAIGCHAPQTTLGIHPPRKAHDALLGGLLLRVLTRQVNRL